MPAASKMQVTLSWWRFHMDAGAGHMFCQPYCLKVLTIPFRQYGWQKRESLSTFVCVSHRVVLFLTARAHRRNPFEQIAAPCNTAIGKR